MAQIIVVLEYKRTVSALTGTNIQAVIDWIKTNIIDKLPPDSSITYTSTLIP